MSAAQTKTIGFNALFQDVHTTFATLVEKKTPDTFESYSGALKTAFSEAYFSTFQNLMDDSGVSDQPFFIEGDGFLLNIFTNLELDTNVQGSILSFIYILEQNIASLTEGDRKVEFLFFHSFGKVYHEAPYLWTLRSIAIAYIKHVLFIPVNEFSTVSDVLPLFHTKAPLFTLLSDAVLNSTETAHLNKLANFSVSGKGPGVQNVSLEQFQFKLMSFAMYLLQHDRRTARLAEVSSLDGMLQALLYKFRGDTDIANLKFPAVLPLDIDEVIFPTPKTSAAGAVATTADAISIFTSISTELCEAGIKSDRLAVLIAALNLFTSTTNKMVTQDFAVFITLSMFSALLSDKLQLKHRPQQVIDSELMKNAAIAKVLDTSQSMYPLFTAISLFSSALAKQTTTANTSICAGALFDIFDGTLLRSFFTNTHSAIVAEQLVSPQFAAVMSVVTKHVVGMERHADVANTAASFLTANTVSPIAITAQVTADLVTTVPSFVQSPTEGPLTTPAAFAAIQWKDLPTIDTQVFKVLLYAIGDNGLVYDQLKDNQQLNSAIAPAAPVSGETIPVEEATPQEEMDEWDADESELDDWDAEDEFDEPAEETPTTVSEITQGEESTNQVAKKSHVALLGGDLTIKDPNAAAPQHWNTFQLVGDGSTMPAAEKEALFRFNPIRVNRDTKYVLRKLIEEYKDRSKPIPYIMPPDEKIQQRCEGFGTFLTFDKAKQWITITMQNLTIKLENSRLTKMNSTKKEYNQSMITPSRIVLRDIVATAEDGGIPSAPPASKVSADKKSTAAAKAPKKGQPMKESVQEKVARELAEKQSKADMDKVTSIVNTLKNAALNKRINELDKKLLAHGDLPSALHGSMVLLDWRIQQWKNQVENKAQQQALSKASSTLTSADAANEAHMEIAVRLAQLLFDLSRRFLAIMSPQQIEAVQAAYALLGFFDSEAEVKLRWKNATGQEQYTAAQIQKLVAEALSKSKSTAERRYAVGTSRSRFLLQHAGHILLRNVNSASDPRVNGFYPDEWQRQLLDIVDRNESALVVAPTSAGKTLVSFYAVSRVLKQNKELSEQKGNHSHKKGIVVFVAPTFPLARQMESDIANRNKEAEVVVHDQNIKLPHMKFDVLITLPQCLENLLTSPSRLEWATRIKYIVFDEVHSIGSTLNGPTWERLFELAHQVPFLALSATVGGVNHFHNWLSSMRKKYADAETGMAKGAAIIAETALTSASQPAPQVSYIKTDVRWSHLQHYFYIPPTAFFTEAFEQVREAGNLTIAAVQPPAQCDGFISLHPVATLALNNSTTTLDEANQVVHTQASKEAKVEMTTIDRRALEGLFNIDFSSADCLQLYDTIYNVLSKSPRFAPQIMNNANSPVQTAENANKLQIIQDDLEALNPDKYFAFFVEKIHTLEYANQMKDLMMKMYDAVLDTEIRDVIGSLSSEIAAILKPLGVATHARQELWKRQFLPLLRSLQQRDWFPAIIFCLDRTLCTDLAYHVVEQLEREEHETWVASNDKRLDKSQKDKEYELAMKQAKRLRDLQNQKKRGSADASKELEEDIRMGLVDPAMLDPDFLRKLRPYNPEDWNADQPDERFSFVKETEWMSDEVRTYWERRIKRRTAKDNCMNGQHPLVKALYRGFGVHHYGVDKQYRDLVEILFRQRNLKFVISIETLGLGVNMPCRTAVFAFTTVALNPLNYRQMSGRAGRRGFDDKGQVIFFGIDPHHACRLMTSSLTPLRGHYNLSCSTVLRLCIKFFFAKESQQHLSTMANTQLTDGSKVKISMSNNLSLLDQMTFLTRSFFTYSEQFPMHVRIQLLHYFRFCMAYFHDMQLFTHGAPSGLAYLLSATATTALSSKIPSYINDAGAFALAYLMRNGYIDELCSTYDKQPEETAQKLMALICHLFFPLRLRNSTDKSSYPAATPLPPQAQDPPLKHGFVVLPTISDSVSPEIATALQEHDALALKLFSRYALAVASTTHAIAQSESLTPNGAAYYTPTTMMTAQDMAQLHDETKQVVGFSQSLPYSKKTTTVEDAPIGDDRLLESFSQTAIQSSLRSPFLAVSTTEGDLFKTPYQLLNSIGKHIDLRPSQIPVYADRYSPGAVTFSSYALDFYLNGCYNDLIICHGIHPAEAWETLQRFTKLLQTLKKAVAILSSNQDEDNDDDFGNADDDDENADHDNDEDTFEILRKSPLYHNVSYVKENLYVKGEAAKKHMLTSKCFSHVFKRYYKFFTSIDRAVSIL